MRGLKTLHVRMERHAQNAMEIAQFLGKPSENRKSDLSRPRIPSAACARAQANVWLWRNDYLFYPGRLDEARTFLEKVKIFTLAESLGGVESLIEHPAIMTHASIPAETRKC